MQRKPIYFRTKYSVIASVAWQSPGREAILKSTDKKSVLFLFLI